GSIRRNPETRLELLDDRHLSVSGGNANDRPHLTGVRVVIEFRAKDVVGRDDAGKGRLDDFTRCRRDDEKRELTAVDPLVEKLQERRNVVAQPHTAASLFQMLATDAPEFRIVPQEIRKLASLLHQVASR